MKKLITCRLLFLALLLLPLVSSAQFYKLSAEILSASCDEINGNSGSITLQVSGVKGQYTYSWSNGSSDAYIKNLPSGHYTVSISNEYGKDTTATFFIQQLLCDPIAELVFTPNGDGINDKWEIGNSQVYPDMLLLVYNRWGQLVYRHTGLYEPWDGKSLLGLPLDDATYYYIIYEKGSDRGAGIVHGSVTIVK
jgi:gliding motility-associated-like protein